MPPGRNLEQVSVVRKPPSTGANGQHTVNLNWAGLVGQGIIESEVKGYVGEQSLQVLRLYSTLICAATIPSSGFMDSPPLVSASNQQICHHIRQTPDLIAQHSFRLDYRFSR